MSFTHLSSAQHHPEFSVYNLYFRKIEIGTLSDVSPN